MNKKIKLIVVGVTSKFACFVCKYPFRVMFIVIIFGGIVSYLCGGDISKIVRGLITLLTICLSLIVMMYLLSNKWCYRIEIDKTNNSIIFYRLCNRAACIFLIDKIRIIIGAYCHIFIGESDFILHADYIHDLVSYLPKDTVIEYKGTIGKYKENHWEKGPLVPGNKL